MKKTVAERLDEAGVQPSAQRVAIGEYVLFTTEHPSADEVFERVRKGFPMVSRATVYNTLHLFVERGLLREYAITEGRVVYDPKVERHHHLVDEDTGELHDIPWEALQVENVDDLRGFAVRDYQVVLRGKKTSRARAK